MKKYLSLLLACVLALALLCACGKKDAAEQTPAPETLSLIHISEPTRPY